jgi:hypothetical protein
MIHPTSGSGRVGKVKDEKLENLFVAKNASLAISILIVGSSLFGVFIRLILTIMLHPPLQIIRCYYIWTEMSETNTLKHVYIHVI